MGKPAALVRYREDPAELCFTANHDYDKIYVGFKGGSGKRVFITIEWKKGENP